MRRLPRPRFQASLLLALAAVALGLPLAGAAPPPPAAGITTPVSGHIAGPAQVGLGLKAPYRVFAVGGPGQAANGSYVGSFSFQASLVGVNTTSASLTPTSGVLTNGTVTITLLAPNVTESLSIYVDVTSSYQGQNQSTNLTYVVDVVRPLVLAASLTVVGPSGVKPFALTVDLDGAPVGSISVPALTAGQTFPVSFSYVSAGLSPGWHTFSVSLAEEHGRVVFAGGAESYSTTFYVPGPAPNYSLWILAGTVAFAGAVFIWATRVGARRRARTKR